MLRIVNDDIHVQLHHTPEQVFDVTLDYVKVRVRFDEYNIKLRRAVVVAQLKALWLSISEDPGSNLVNDNFY